MSLSLLTSPRNPSRAFDTARALCHGIARSRRSFAKSPTSSLSHHSSSNTKTSASCSHTGSITVPAVYEFSFWRSRPAWKRASMNTLRCLVGCTAGDFTAMWTLQSFYPNMSVGITMSTAMAAGITTSMILETVLLKRGKDRLPWPEAFKTAAGMSFISMLTMEAAENAVDYHLTGGIVAFDDPAFWFASVAAIGAGFLAPLPYNYFRLRKYSQACH